MLEKNNPRSQVKIMSTKEEKELERKRKQREKELKILRASNEMLENALQNVREHGGNDMDNIIAEIEKAKEENLQMAMSYHKANPTEVASMEYNKVNKKSIDEYNRRLEAKHITDEMLHQKELAIAHTTATTTDKNTKTKRVRKSKSGEQNVKTSITEKTEENVREEVQQPIVFVSNPVSKTQLKNKYESNEWDLSNVPEYVQFDMIPLPSKGQCYPIDSPLRSGVIPVSYLTASDENLIHSPNMYRDGKIIDIIISRKIVDKRVKASDLCKGDRDAVTLWLRATGYGDDFPIIVHNPNLEGKVYNTKIKLSELHYLPFNLQGDENGLFTYVTTQGDVIKFKQITKLDEDFFKKQMAEQLSNDTKMRIFNSINDIKYYFSQIQNQDFEEKEEIKLDIDEIVEWSGNSEVEDEDIMFNAITESMLLKTISINGNETFDYIKGYIENMRTTEAYAYRRYMDENIPGVDFKIKINIPESDGGGSFDTFLRTDDLIFRNV